HADDNIETVMMNFFKGSGIAGLRGILPKKDKLVRPLLFVHKEELLQFAREERLQYVEDSSNISDKYTRNYFRNQLIPQLTNIFPAVRENLVHNIKRFRDTEQLYQEALAANLKKLVETRGNEIHLPVLKLRKLSYKETVMYEILKPFGFSSLQASEAILLLDSETGKYVQSLTHRVVRNRAWLIVTPVNTGKSTTVVVEEGDKEIIFEAGGLAFSHVPIMDYKILAENAVAALDVAGVQFPLILRKWKKGDYFYPLGLARKKKISRFLIDQKLSLPQKENTWVLEMNKKIIWVINRRIDDRFKILPNTKTVLEIRFNSGSK
ncbi:MAG: tRNA lysidine(34) synthetase TilS, partial [Ferruginibacter sp.]|nr:tRNA lysidine(34) synthetase TilS [Chitinophagaceae bacterium]